MSKPEQFDQWAVIELFGHNRIAGRVTEQVIGGCSFVRVDVPKIDEIPAYTKLFGQGAIYAITITDERTSRAVAEQIAPVPIDRFELGTIARNMAVKLLKADQEQENQRFMENEED
jgi:hypothetical protein